MNDNDLVPHLPLRWCYRHVGHLKLLTRDGRLLEQDSDWKDKKRQLVKHAKHVQRAHRNDDDPHLKLGEFDWLADHHLDGYLKGIAGLLPRVPRRRHPEYAGIELDAVPLHYLDEPAEPAVRRPKMLDAPAAAQSGNHAKRVGGGLLQAAAGKTITGSLTNNLDKLQDELRRSSMANLDGLTLHRGGPGAGSAGGNTGAAGGATGTAPGSTGTGGALFSASPKTSFSHSESQTRNITGPARPKPGKLPRLVSSSPTPVRRSVVSPGRKCRATDGSEGIIDRSRRPSLNPLAPR